MKETQVFQNNLRITDVGRVAEKNFLKDKTPVKLGRNIENKPQEAKKIFLVIEGPENKWHYPLNEWLGRINYNQVMMKKRFGSELEVWEIN